jgi:DNA-binding beta-propeller fold protein YncE
MHFLPKKKRTFPAAIFAASASVILLGCLAIVMWFWRSPADPIAPLRHVSTVAGIHGEFGEPFGIAVNGADIYLSDGQNGKIWRVSGGVPAVFAEGLDTPSGIVFDKAGNLIVADSGSHTVKSINPKGDVSIIAGTNGRFGFADGDSSKTLFNGPIGIAIDSSGRIFVADTYNDRIRVIDNGKVSTIAGGSSGFAEGRGAETKFHTPCGIAIWHDKMLVADAGNRRIRVVESDGRVGTLAGTGELGLKDGLLSSSSFVQPTAITVDNNGFLFIADGNAIRRIGGNVFPVVQTISNETRGIIDGEALTARFNRPSGLIVNTDGDLLVADSDNRLIRSFSAQKSGHEMTAGEIADRRDKPEEFRVAQPPRWPFDPPDARRDIAGTLGEIRGEIPETEDPARFHNGLDIAGAYGETAVFVRDEKVLLPIAAQNFGSLRELLRMPTIGYIHIRLGRNVTSAPFADERFRFERDPSGKLAGVRIPRGTKFKAGEAIGTLNPMNHVHLIAGRPESEMNALDALIFPGLTDSRPPTIENVTLFDENWQEIETQRWASRIRLTGKTRVVVRAFDQADGNSDRRRLGVYKIGYQILGPDNSPAADTKWTLQFDRMPSSEAVKLVYATGSRSGATGETIFNYIATNYVDGSDFHEDFLDAAALENGNYKLRVFAADYFGNVSFKDISIEVLR